LGEKFILNAGEGNPAEGAQVFKPENHIKTPFIANRMGVFMSKQEVFLTQNHFSIAVFIKFL
jgi:hypothetical protein